MVAIFLEDGNQDFSSVASWIFQLERAAAHQLHICFVPKSPLNSEGIV
jgi:hypothetical protein